MNTPSASLPATAERQSLVDALRGFALFGILVVNLVAFASPYYGLGIPDPNAQSFASQGAALLIAGLFETKFYLLFSFLFGYSFTLQMESAQRAGASFAPRILRRLLGLWVIGLLHAIFLYHGDILTTYAVLGLLLLMLRTQRDGRLCQWALWLIVATALLWAGIGVLASLDPAAIDTGNAKVRAAAALAAYRGTPATVVAQHLYEFTQVWAVLGLMQAPTALAMFLLGLVAGKRRLLAQVEGYRQWFGRLLLTGLVIGLPGAAWYAWASVRLMGVPEIFGLSLSLLTAPFLTAAYVGGMMLLFDTRAGRILADLLAPAGRMALSNYVLQSLICSLVFFAYGWRMMGQVTPWAGLLLAAAIFSVQLLVSRWWLHHFSYGPLEWLLRAFTNLRISPLQRRRQSAGN